MLFTDPVFLVFFFLIFFGYWGLRSNHPRKVLLLIGSYVFYGAWDYRFLGLIVASTLIDFVVGRILRFDGAARRRRVWLILSLVSNLGILGFFKYFNFFIDSGVGLLGFFGFEQNPRSLSIILPVGISFFTFQSMSYTIDVYRRRIKPISSPVDFALFVSFFPQLVAGPIVRASEFLPQLTETKVFKTVAVRRLLLLFLIGFIKKACIADNLAPAVDRVFSSPLDFDTGSIWVAVLFYATQIYCDFSGYTDMAIATAGFLGYELPVNFRAPYFARNITEFWQRWHISLSGWLRDYLYISLGGNRGSRFFVARNLMITMLLGGLWHGASWNFVIWGGLHGFALIAHKKWLQARGHSFARFSAGGVRTVLSTGLTFYWVCICWVLFRSESIDVAGDLFRGFVLFSANGSETIGFGNILWMIPIGVTHWLLTRWSPADAAERLPGWLFSFLYGLGVAAVLACIPTGTKPFIYFQF